MDEQLGRYVLSILTDSEKRSGKNGYIEEIREKADELEPHFDDDYPAKLLNSQHPGEQPWMKSYRKERWEPPTRTATGRIYTSLQKIQQSDDFKILFTEDFKETGVIEQNSLKRYLTEGLPKFKNLETWLFTVNLQSYLENPNGVCLVAPDLTKWIDTVGSGFDVLPDFNMPYPQLFEEKHIVWKEEEFIILKMKCFKKAGKEWDQFLVVSMIGYQLYRQFKPYKDGEDVFNVFSLPYTFQTYPVIDNGNIIYEIEDGQIVYNSIVTPCLPAWNECLFRADDLIVNWALHGNPIFWRYRDSPCKTCNGTGQIKDRKLNGFSNCGTCGGNGLASEGSPFATIQLNPQKANAANPDMPQLPTPPAGYIKLDGDAIKSQTEDIDRNLYKGYQAIGLEFLANVPLAQSGVAKALDRQEVNTFYYQVAVHLAATYEKVALRIFEQRSSTLIGSGLITPEQAKNNLPKLVVPTDFDVMTAAIISEALGVAVEKKFDPILVAGLTSDYTEKIFGEDSYQLKLLKLRNQLDPLPFISSEDKMVLKDSMGCTELDYITSSYLVSFINLLTEQNPKWPMESPEKQRQDLNGLAIIKLQEIKSSIVPIMPVN